jgi:hypothetical protein
MKHINFAVLILNTKAMKKRIVKPGFDFLFSAGIAAMLAIPQMVWAQKETRKDVRIIIRDKDTTYNGKHLKDLPATERQQALTEINKMGQDGLVTRRRTYVFRRPGSNERDTLYSMNLDSLRTTARIRINPREGMFGDRMEDNRPRLQFRFDEDALNRRLDGLGLRGDRPGLHLRGFNRRNSQNFNFTYTDNEGITTNFSYHVTDVQGEAAKKFAGVTQANMELADLTLTPQFSAGKTILSFNLPAKAAADVQLTDNEGKTIWKDKAANGAFSKTFTWALNGAYYLVVKQGSQVAVKRIVKE